MKNQRGFYNFDFLGIMYGIVFVGILIGIALAIGVPFVWEWIKPFIHALTA